MSRHGTRPPNSTWTVEDERFLIDNYGTLTGKECADKLGKKLLTVYSHCGRLGLTKKQSLANSEHTNWRGHGKISGKFWSGVQRSAKLRKIDFEISIEEAWTLFEAQGGKCAISGADLQFWTNDRQRDGTASLDRKDSTALYTLENCQWLHRTVNYMKQSLTDAEFIEWCRIIANHNRKN